MYNNPAINEQQRTVILYNISKGEGKGEVSYIQFDVAAPLIDPIDKTLSINVLSSQLFNFTDPVLNYDIFECENVSILYVGDSNFTYFCEGGSYFAVWHIPNY